MFEYPYSWTQPQYNNQKKVQEDKMRKLAYITFLNLHWDSSSEWNIKLSIFERGKRTTQMIQTGRPPFTLQELTHQVHTQTTAPESKKLLQWQRSHSHSEVLTTAFTLVNPFQLKSSKNLSTLKKIKTFKFQLCCISKQIHFKTGSVVTPSTPQAGLFMPYPGHLWQRSKEQTRNWRENENDCLTAEILQTKTKRSVLGQVADILSTGTMSHLELRIWCHPVPPDHTSCFSFCVIKWPQPTGMSLATRQEKNKRYTARISMGTWHESRGRRGRQRH